MFVVPVAFAAIQAFSMPLLTTEGSSFFPAVFAVAFLYLSLAVGRRMLILLGATGGGTPIERGIVATGLGAGVLQFVPFVLGTFGLLTKASVFFVIGFVVLAAAADLRAVAVAVITAVRREPRPSYWTIAWLVALSPAVVAAGLAALAPTVDPDGLSYHLMVPKRWLHTEALDYLPTYPYSNAPMGAQMLFVVGMAFAGDVAAKCIHYSLGLVAVAAIFFTGLRLSGLMVGLVPATLFLVGPGGLAAILGSAYVEGATALATAGSALAWSIWYQTDNRGYLRGAAMLAGIAVSFKITSALFPVALLALTMVATATKSRDEKITIDLGSSAYLGLLSAASLIPFISAPILPWLARSFLMTGNPFFPLFANVIPSRDLPADLAIQADRYNRYMLWGSGFGRDWTIDERAWVLLSVAAVLVLSGAIAFFKLRGAAIRGAVVVVTITGLIQLSAAGLYIRYWLPITAVLMIPIASLFAPILSRRSFMLAWIGLTLTGSLVQVYKSGFDVSVVRVVAGLDKRVDFLRSHVPLYPLYELANRELPPNAGIMLSVYCGAFYIDRRTYCAEMVHDAIRFTTWQEFTEDLRRHRISHVIAPIDLATGGPTPHLGGASVSAVTRVGQYRLVRKLLTSHARTLATAFDQGLYEIAPALLDEKN